ncbi:MAG: cytidyltransferase-related domain [Candidatus Taylorbacteria bacterium]|nr:cytidyltransferase-related domain [Candidatus Taylorbacteria bacterium]
MKSNSKKVLVFGTFDRLHPGHLYFLTEAKKLGHLYISVSSDESALQRKGKNPIHNIKERMEALRQLNIAVEVLEGDKTLNEWTAIKIAKPDIIALGFDQYGLKTALIDIKSKFGFDIQVMNKNN